MVEEDDLVNGREPSHSGLRQMLFLLEEVMQTSDDFVADVIRIRVKSVHCVIIVFLDCDGFFAKLSQFALKFFYAVKRIYNIRIIRN